MELISRNEGYKAIENEDPSFTIQVKYDDKFEHYIILDMVDVVELRDLFNNIINYVIESPEWNYEDTKIL